MKLFQDRTWVIAAGLMLAMAATRFHHFGSAVSLPDASYAVFFLSGLYLARSARASRAVFIALVLEACIVDYYATSVQGISDFCITPAYGFLFAAYCTLWIAGQWFAPRLVKEGHSVKGKGLIGLALTTGAAASFAFLLSSGGFYLFSGHFNDMKATEYASSVTQYFGWYVAVTLLYVACAAAIHMAHDIIRNRSARTTSDVA